MLTSTLHLTHPRYPICHLDSSTCILELFITPITPWRDTGQIYSGCDLEKSLDQSESCPKQMFNLETHDFYKETCSCIRFLVTALSIPLNNQPIYDVRQGRIPRQTTVIHVVSCDRAGRYLGFWWACPEPKPRPIQEAVREPLQTLIVLGSKGFSLGPPEKFPRPFPDIAFPFDYGNAIYRRWSWRYVGVRNCPVIGATGVL